MGIRITRSVVICQLKSLRKERALIYPDLLARAHASEGGSGAGAVTALSPSQVAAAKATGAVRI